MNNWKLGGLQIRVLDLSNNNLRDQGAQVLAKCLGADNKCLYKLNLSSNNITYLGAEPLFKALLQNQSVIDLNMASDVESNNCNKLGFQGAEMLAGLLKQ
jgi:Ran GTPase-activating protein (RanGAP) involved in mRNA processing and transport